jgi:integrase
MPIRVLKKRTVTRYQVDVTVLQPELGKKSRKRVTAADLPTARLYEQRLLKGDLTVIDEAAAALAAEQATEAQAAAAGRKGGRGAGKGAANDEPSGPDTKFDVYAHRWFLHKRRTVKPATARAYDQVLRNHAAPLLKGLAIGQITQGHISAYLDALLAPPDPELRPLSHKTVNNHIAVLNGLFGSAMHQGHIDRNPMEGITGCQLPLRPMRAVIPLDTYPRFVEAAYRVGQPYAAALCTLVYTGLRLGELAALTWECVDFTPGRESILVRASYTHGVLGTPKSGNNRVVVISETLAELLRAHRGDAKASALCFSYARAAGDPEADAHLNSSRLRAALNRTLKAAQLPALRIHDLRHSFASALVNSGQSVRAAQEILGHSDLKTTERYLHSDSAAQRKAISIFDAPQSPAR